MGALPGASAADVPGVSGLLKELLAEVRELAQGRVRENVQGASLTTFAIGGPLAALVTVETEVELAAVLSVLHGAGQRVFVVGNGSNLLIGDTGIVGWIIRLGSTFRTVEDVGPGKVRVSGAASLMSVARKLSDAGLSGLEFAAGIPASVGGAVFMNAGAHGGEMCERIVRVSSVLSNGDRRVFEAQELPWRYRSSGLPQGCVVTSVELELIAGSQAEISARCAQFLAERRVRQPLSQPSAGSVFKNPSPEQPAGKVLEQCGLKGARVGGAIVSDLHANWIVNPDRNATAADVMELMTVCRI
jgi:UDP-N-acetylmuramate dehydrogenase